MIISRSNNTLHILINKTNEFTTSYINDTQNESMKDDRENTNILKCVYAAVLETHH